MPVPKRFDAFLLILALAGWNGITISRDTIHIPGIKRAPAPVGRDAETLIGYRATPRGGQGTRQGPVSRPTRQPTAGRPQITRGRRAARPNRPVRQTSQPASRSQAQGWASSVRSSSSAMPSAASTALGGRVSARPTDAHMRASRKPLQRPDSRCATSKMRSRQA